MKWFIFLHQLRAVCDQIPLAAFQQLVNDGLLQYDSCSDKNSDELDDAGWPKKILELKLYLASRSLAALQAPPTV